MATTIEYLINKDGQRFYPVTHMEAIIVEGTTTIDQFLTQEATKSKSGLMSSDDKTKLDKFGDASIYATQENVEASISALKTNLTSIYNFKGTVESVDGLPAHDDNKIGDVYKVSSPPANYMWNGSTWIDMYIKSIENEQIDSMFT